MQLPTYRIDGEKALGAVAASTYRDLILAHERVRVARVRCYSPPPSLQRRLPTSPSSQTLVDAAMKRRERADVPFWQAVMLTIQQSQSVPDDLLEAALYHQDIGPSYDLTRTQLERGELEELSRNGASLVALDSQVDLGNEGAHLPFMDFRITPSEANTRLVASICRRLMSDGFVLLTSGRSYHACGVALQRVDERVDFLGKALLFSPIVDDRYIAHQLMQPSSLLRVSTPSDGGSEPHVVTVWYPA